jgi:hypothetical protein
MGRWTDKNEKAMIELVPKNPKRIEENEDAS